MQTYRDYFEARQAAADAISGITEQLSCLGAEAKAEQLRRAKFRLLSDDFRIIFCGEFKRGKSTLINAMLGERVLPMKVAPCTGVITEVKYSDTPRVRVYPNEGGAFDAPFDELYKHIAIQGEEAPDIDKVDIFYPLQLCETAVTLIDSPGLNEDWRRTRISLREVAKADAAVMVLSCEMALSRSEMDFIRTHLADRKAGLFFIWNRYDSIWENNEEIASLRERSASRLDPYGGEAFYLSAREALAAQRKKDGKRLNRSGLLPFMDSLEAFLATERGKAKLVGPIVTSLQAAEYGIDTLYPRAIGLLEAPLEELRKTEDKLRPKLAELERKREHAKEAIQEAVEDILDDLILCLDDFLGTVSQQAFKDSEAVELPEAANRQERQDTLLRWFRSWLRDALHVLAKEKMGPILHNGLKELQEDLQIQRENFHADIRDLLDLETDLDLSSSPLFDAEWLNELPLFISTAVALLMLGASTSAVAISLLGVGALRAWLTGLKLDEQDRLRLAEALSTGLVSQREDIIQLLRGHLQQSCDEIRDNVQEEMNLLIKDTHQQLGEAIKARSEGQERASQKRNVYEEAKKALQRLRKQLNEIDLDD
jgi:hypothetical protein